MKTCSKCKEEKGLDEFSLNKGGKHGRHSKCKCCVNIYRVENKAKIARRKKEYYEINKDDILAKRKEYCIANKDAVAAAKKAAYKKEAKIKADKKKAYYEANKDAILESKKKHREKMRLRAAAKQREYYKANADKLNAAAWVRRKERLETDPAFKMIMNIRRRQAIALEGNRKAATTMKLLGCTAEHARAHIEGQFTEGMSWDKYGMHGFHIDHIIPLASFDLSDPEQQRQALHYTNLQPLWAKDNLRKGDKLPKAHQPELPIAI